MAPNRKKKKPAGNPARGFATTSTASKSKFSDDTSSQDAVSQEVIAKHEPVLSVIDSSSLKQPDKELCDLTPEELERQLEESELQLLVEKYAEKTKKDVTRQVSRLQTERRLLRGQAERLSISAWLPQELMTMIVDHLEKERNRVTAHEYKSIQPPPSLEDLCIKVWTLRRALKDLGFTNERAQQAVSYLLENPQMKEQAFLNLSRDTLWGIDECLDYLALLCSPGEVPDYETHLTKVKPTITHSCPDINISRDIGKLSLLPQDTMF